MRDHHSRAVDANSRSNNRIARMSHSAAFEAVPESVSLARRFVVEQLHGCPADLCERAALLVSELATNAVKHARSRFEVAIETSREKVRVEVRDFGDGSPRRREPFPSELTGRGLMIVDAMAESWGVSEEEDSKVVWFELTSS